MMTTVGQERAKQERRPLSPPPLRWWVAAEPLEWAAAAGILYFLLGVARVAF